VRLCSWDDDNRLREVGLLLMNVMFMVMLARDLLNRDEHGPLSM